MRKYTLVTLALYLCAVSGRNCDVVLIEISSVVTVVWHLLGKAYLL